jgi:hypothetical protein
VEHIRYAYGKKRHDMDLAGVRKCTVQSSPPTPDASVLIVTRHTSHGHDNAPAPT